MASVGEPSSAYSITSEEREEDEVEDIPVVPEGAEGLQVTAGGGMSFGERLIDFKDWSVIQGNCMRQYWGEWMGWKGRTVDVQLTERVGKLREARAGYLKMVVLAERMRTGVAAMSETQRELSYMLNDMAAANSKIPAGLHATMKQTSAAQIHIAGRDKLLMAALDSFIKNVKTLVRVAIDDLLSQIPTYKAMRVEYDAYRNSLESAKESAKGAPSAFRERTVQRAEDGFRLRQEKFISVRRELLVRVRFLEQNEASVMRKQLVLLQNATCAFYSGQSDNLHKCLKEFHIKAPKVLHDPATSALAAAAAENPLALHETLSASPLPH